MPGEGSPPTDDVATMSFAVEIQTHALTTRVSVHPHPSGGVVVTFQTPQGFSAFYFGQEQALEFAEGIARVAAAANGAGPQIEIAHEMPPIFRENGDHRG